VKTEHNRAVVQCTQKAMDIIILQHLVKSNLFRLKKYFLQSLSFMALNYTRICTATNSDTRKK